MKKFNFILLGISLCACSVIGAAEPAAAPKFSSEQVMSLWNANQKSAAMKMLEQWKAAEKNSPEPYVTEAGIAFGQKKYKKVLKLGAKALDKSSSSAGGYYWRGQAYEALSNNLDAGNEYRAALISDPSYAPAKEALSRLSQSQGVSDFEQRNQASTDEKP